MVSRAPLQRVRKPVGQSPEMAVAHDVDRRVGLGRQHRVAIHAAVVGFVPELVRLAAVPVRHRRPVERAVVPRLHPPPRHVRVARAEEVVQGHCKKLAKTNKNICFCQLISSASSV
jgi:hypothetical protein